MELEQIYDIFLRCGGRLTTDSRKISGGELFLALKGENFDGNLYAMKALEAGAAYAVVEKSCPDTDGRLIFVDSTFQTLRALASLHRESLRVSGGRLPVIALTGTNGKTTTKELIRAVLSTRYRVSATQGNLNNDIGVPLTLLSFTGQTQIGLVEMGASHPGDIVSLVEVAHPDYGLITNVGKAHLLGFGSFEGVKKTKGELYDYIAAAPSSSRIVFVNQDNEHLREMLGERPGLKAVPYGVHSEGARLLPCDAEHPFLRLVVDGLEIDTRLVGAYNADNVMAALAVGRYFGVELKDAAAAISAYEPANSRSQMLRTSRNTLIVDAYNANPSSMEVALDNFAGIVADCKIALLGDMRELGEDSAAEHLKLRRRVESMIASGQLTSACFVGSEFARSGDSFESSEALADYLRRKQIAGATILIKGSRGVRMENVIDALR